MSNQSHPHQGCNTYIHAELYTTRCHLEESGHDALAAYSFSEEKDPLQLSSMNPVRHI